MNNVQNFVPLEMRHFVPDWSAPPTVLATSCLVEDLVWRLLENGIMESNAPANAPAEGADVVFSCERCGAPLVVDGAAAGLTLNCQRCGGPTTVPHPSAPELPE